MKSFQYKESYLPNSVSLFIIRTPRGEGGTPYNSLYGRSPPKRGGLQSVKGSCVLRRFFLKKIYHGSILCSVSFDSANIVTEFFF